MDLDGPDVAGPGRDRIDAAVRATRRPAGATLVAVRTVRGRVRARTHADVPTSGEAAELWSRVLRRRGALVLSVLGVCWSAVAATGLSTQRGLWLVGGAVVLAGLFAGVAHRSVPRSEGGMTERLRDHPAQWRRLLVRTGGSLGLVLAVVLVLGVATGSPQVLAPFAAAAMGVHGLPAAYALDQPEYRWAGVGLVLAAATGIALLIAAVPYDVVRDVVGGLAAISLLGTAARLSARP